MFKILTAVFILFSATAYGQDNACLEQILAKKGNWVPGSVTKNNAPDYVMQKAFLDAAHKMMQAYEPQGVQAQTFAVHTPAAYNNPFHSYKWWIGGFSYLCSGDNKLTVAHETYNGFRVHINNDFNRQLFDNNNKYDGTGFTALREGMPEEVRPGVWRFKEVWTPLGFSREGLTKLWLLTYPGKLPWQYVSRKEFLENRRQMLLTELKKEDESLSQKMADLEKTKQNIEKVTKTNPAQYAAWIKNDYEPAPARYRDYHQKTTANFKRAIEVVNDQLQAAAAELVKPAIVIKSEQNHLDYSFTENWQERFAQVLIKPNPGYFKTGISKSIPQLVELSIQYYPEDQVSVLFAKTTEKLVDLVYLQQFIGKTAPPVFKGSSTSQQAESSAGNKLPAASPTISTSTAPKPGKAAHSSTATAQPASSQTGSFLTGTLSAPTGVAVTLSNGTNDITITPPKSKEKVYSSTPIRFTQALKKGESFNVAVKKIAGNMKAVVYRGSGKAPDDKSNIKIGVDYKYELLTRSSDDKQFSNFYESSAPAIGGMGAEEGRYVCFVSWTKGFAGNDGKFRQVFWRDRNTGLTKMISVSPDGAPADADCALPTMSADGKTVVFESKASNLVAGDLNKTKDIFLWRAATNSIELVSKTSSGAVSNGESYDAMLSGNGQFVVFTSDAANMTGIAKGKSVYNIFLRDLVNGKTQILSVDPVSKTGGNGSKASISYDGNRVTFCSPFNTLTSNDNNNLWDIFLWESGKNGLRRISLTHDGKERNQGDESGSRQVSSTLSGNGRYVVYSTTASNMVPGDGLKYQDVFVYDINSNQLQVASFTNDGQPGNYDSPIEQGERMAISYDGTWVAFPTKASNLGSPSSNIILYNTQTKTKTPVTETKGSYVGRPAISYSGSYVVFGKSEALDQRSGAAFGDNAGGLFAYFTGNGPCRDCGD